MTNTAQLREFLETITEFTPTAQASAITHEAGNTQGGEIIFPNPDTPKGLRPSWRITAHGITASGFTQMEMIQNWIRRANKLYRPEVEADGFISWHLPFGIPRNDAEEIGNACATA
jgi:hypothetical protein